MGDWDGKADMAQEFATLTAKGQVTVPKAVRDALGLRQGDQLSWVLEEGWVRVRPITPLDQAYLKSLESQLGEWSGDDDEQAFADL
jgi:antitoxin PrlF